MQWLSVYIILLRRLCIAQFYLDSPKSKKYKNVTGWQWVLQIVNYYWLMDMNYIVWRLGPNQDWKVSRCTKIHVCFFTLDIIFLEIHHSFILNIKKIETVWKKYVDNWQSWGFTLEFSYHIFLCGLPVRGYKPGWLHRWIPQLANVRQYSF